MDLNNTILRCEDEPIHIPNLIQPIGYFFGIGYEDLSIKYVSENILDISDNKNAKDFLDKSILDLFDNIHLFIDDFKSTKDLKRKIFFNIKSTILKHQVFDLFISQYIPNELLFEFIPKNIDTNITINTEFWYDKIVQNLTTQANTIDLLFNLVTSNIKSLTNYDRVMLYKFDSDYNGEVIAESKNDSLESYLHLHYPAGDIPAQARSLYLKNKTRIIANANYKPSNVFSYSNQPIDMSLSFLRSVSPIHLEYMQNMGVQASMTISIIINDKLWGLIACHNGSEFMPNIETIHLCEKIAQVVSYLIKIFEQKEYESNKNKFLGTIDTIVSIMKQNITHKDSLTFISDNIEMFKPLFDADGVVFLHDSSIVYSGYNLDKVDIQNFVECIYRMNFHNEFITSSLIDHFKGLNQCILKECAGVVALKLPSNSKTMLIWTKVEQVQTINWGGNPDDISSKMTLTPRKSFEKFSQIVTFKSIRWEDTTEHKLQIVLKKLQDVFDLDSTTNILKHQKNIISSLEEEKVKNQFQLIEMLISMIEQRDAYTAGHTQRVASYCVLIAKELGLSEYDILLLDQAAKLHDIGKISIPDSLLLKPARLNQNEYSLIKQHLNVGYDILSKIDYYKEIAEIMKYHHEKYDGSGYPDGKRGDEISITSNIMIVADALDAMTSNRIYQKRKSIDEAISEIVKYKGIWYHPKVVDTLVLIYNKGYISTVETNQLPLTQMEEERFSYFFKDQLTSFYNDSYLWMILNNQIPTINSKYFLIIELKEMSQYNKLHNWHNGSILIKNIAQYIAKKCEQKLIFRVFGDDFVLVFDDKEIFEDILIKWNEVKIGNVYTTLKSISRNELIDKMESFW